jgi:hypothetical protein
LGGGGGGGGGRLDVDELELFTGGGGGTLELDDELTEHGLL